jgi:hypothetical protein
MLADMDGEGSFVPSVDTLKYEVLGRLRDLEPALGKTHLSARWEPATKIARLGVCVENYTWQVHEDIVKRLVQLQLDHQDDFALEFDVIPVEGVRDDEYAEV